MRYPVTAQTLILASAVAASANAGVIRHDVDDALYQQLGQQSQFGAVGQLGLSFSNGNSATCSGTLISDEWILTAAHCVEQSLSSVAFVNGSGFAFVDEIVIHPDWGGSNNILNGGDLALLHISSSINAITPAMINTERNELGSIGTIVGFGRTGDGFSGSLFGTDGTLRAGNNVIDVLGDARGWDDRIMLADFDNPINEDDSIYGSSTPLDLEYSIAPGDSGGAMFLETAQGWRLAGISSFINSTDGSPNGDYGDTNGFTRVSDYSGWINSVVPTPGTLPMLAAGLMLGARRRR